MPRIRRLIALLTLAATTTLAHAQERMTPELLWKLGRVGAPQVSPDGSMVCYSVTRYDIEANSGNADLWLWSNEDGEVRRLTTHDKSESIAGPGRPTARASASWRSGATARARSGRSRSAAARRRS